MSKKTTIILKTALLTAAIFLIIIAVTSNIILLFLTTIPLLSVGLSKDPKIALQAGALATTPIALLTNNLFFVALFFLIFVLPCWYICHKALIYYDVKLTPNLPVMRLWYPMGVITIYLALYSCVLLAIITAIFATQDSNLPQVMEKIVKETADLLNKDYDIIIDNSIGNIAFILCGCLAWIWVFFLMGYTWFVNHTLIKKNLAKRPNMMISRFPMPHWLLTLMGICALASLIGGESISFLGKASLFILLIPYFFQGAAIIQIFTKKPNNNTFFIFIFYFLALVLFWPTIIIAGIGLWDHIKVLNKRLSSGGS